MLEWLWPATVAASADRHTYFSPVCNSRKYLALGFGSSDHAERRPAIREAAFSQ